MVRMGGAAMRQKPEVRVWPLSSANTCFGLENICFGKVVLEVRVNALHKCWSEGMFWG
jgi:hypothetical protein